MALISIKIADLQDAESNSSTTARKAQGYRDELNDKILKKINSYSGDWTSNMTTAQSNVTKKCDELDTKNEAFTTYERDIEDLRCNIENQEKRLTDRIETIVGNYCAKYGLEDDKSWWQKLAEFFIRDDVLEFFKAIGRSIDALGRVIKNWYRFEGGREALNVVCKVLGTVLAAIGLVLATIATFGATSIIAGIFALAGVVTSIVALADSMVATRDACKAYSAAMNDDPVWARRYETHSDNASFTDDLRRNGQYFIADVVDFANTVATILEIVDLASSLYKGFKKLNGKSLIDKGKDYFKKFGNNLKGNWAFMKNKTFCYWSHFGSGERALKTVKTGLSLVSTVLDSTRLVLNGEGWEGTKKFFKSLGKTAMQTVFKFGSKSFTAEMLGEIAFDPDYAQHFADRSKFKNAADYEKAVVDQALKFWAASEALDKATNVKATPGDVWDIFDKGSKSFPNLGGDYGAVLSHFNHSKGNLTSVSSFNRFTGGSLLN